MPSKLSKKISRKINKSRSKLIRAMTLLRYRLANRFSRQAVCAVDGPVVSLTSYSTRIDSVYLTLESIAAGVQKPSRLILWLDELARVEHPPASLRRLQERGLEIRPCANYGPHKKYYPFVAQLPLDGPLVTADDDVLYPAYWLERLSTEQRKTPGQVICYKARRIQFVGQELAAYVGWPAYLGLEASYRNFAVGVSGVLYPAALLHCLREQGEGFTASCPKADDIWLHLHALKTGYPVRQISTRDEHFLSIPGTQDIALFKGNIKKGENDRVLAALYSTADLQRIRQDPAEAGGQ